VRALLVLVLMPAIAAADPPSVAPGDIATTVAHALAKPDPKAPRGTAVVIGTLDKLDVAVQAKALRQALAKLPLAVIEDRTEPTGVVITVEAASKARAVIVLGPEGGTLSIVARPRATRPPGPGVAIPNVVTEVDVHSSGVDQKGERRERSTFWRMATSRRLDVDGDGLIDLFVPIPPKQGVCPEDFTYRVFVVRGSCGHEVGVIGPGQLTWDAGTVPLDSSGYRPITLEHRRARHGQDRIPVMTTTTRRFVMVGGSYRQDSIATSSGRCHHCSVWHCTKR
jgi:hypothetical protein